jgi:predicted metal-dependent hydrolase
MEPHLRAGIAVYNDGEHHAAHDAWEDRWLDLESGTDDERFLHGLIQFTAAVHHGHEGNWAGLQGLADSAGEYLDGLPSPYRGVDLDPVRAYLADLAADPEHIERVEPPRLRHEGRAPSLADLAGDGEFEAVAVAARVLAEEYEAYDGDVIEAGIAYARESVEAGESGRFTALVFDFVAGEERGLVHRRLREHVERRRSREADVEGLFDPE